MNKLNNFNGSKDPAAGNPQIGSSTLGNSGGEPAPLAVFPQSCYWHVQPHHLQTTWDLYPLIMINHVLLMLLLTINHVIINHVLFINVINHYQPWFTSHCAPWPHDLEIAVLNPYEVGPELHLVTCLWGSPGLLAREPHCPALPCRRSPNP